jgi:hypothetical protein
MEAIPPLAVSANLQLLLLFRILSRPLLQRLPTHSLLQVFNIMLAALESAAAPKRMF